MSLVFAVHWKPARDHAFIDYMAINDENFEYEIEPVRLKVNASDFSKFENIARKFFRDHKNVKLEYKSVMRGSRMGRKPRNDSVDFHNTIKQIISECKVKKHKRLRSDLKSSANTKFTNFLFKCKLVNKKNIYAWRRDLWAVAFHATKGTVDKIIKKNR